MCHSQHPECSIQFLDPTIRMEWSFANCSSETQKIKICNLFISVASNKTTQPLCSQLPQKKWAGVWEEDPARIFTSALSFQYIIADQAQGKKKKKTHKTKLNKIDPWKGRDLWKQNYQGRMVSIQPMMFQSAGAIWSSLKEV